MDHLFIQPIKNALTKHTISASHLLKQIQSPLPFQPWTLDAPADGDKNLAPAAFAPDSGTAGLAHTRPVSTLVNELWLLKCLGTHLLRTPGMSLSGWFRKKGGVKTVTRKMVNSHLKFSAKPTVTNGFGEGPRRQKLWHFIKKEI